MLSSIGLSESSCRIGLVSQYVLVSKRKKTRVFLLPFFLTSAVGTYLTPDLEPEIVSLGKGGGIKK